MYCITDTRPSLINCYISPALCRTCRKRFCIVQERCTGEAICDLELLKQKSSGWFVSVQVSQADTLPNQTPLHSSLARMRACPKWHGYRNILCYQSRHSAWHGGTNTTTQHRRPTVVVLKLKYGNLNPAWTVRKSSTSFFLLYTDLSTPEEDKTSLWSERHTCGGQLMKENASFCRWQSIKNVKRWVCGGREIFATKDS